MHIRDKGYSKTILLRAQYFSTMAERIEIDVNGQIFKVHSNIIENGPSSRLKRLYKTGLSTSKVDRIVLNRPTESFTAILAFYQTGELHIPMTSCPGAYMSELEYWEISPEMLSNCCLNRLQSFLDEQNTLRNFKERQEKAIPSKNRCLDRVRSKIWEVVDYTKPTIIGKIYFILTCFMVLLSTSVLAYSTDLSFQREMTNCERLEYMTLTNMAGHEMMKPYLEQLCRDSQPPSNFSESLVDENSTDLINLLLQRQIDENSKNEFLTYLFSFVQNFLVEADNKVSLLEEWTLPEILLDIGNNETVFGSSVNKEEVNNSVWSNSTKLREVLFNLTEIRNISVKSFETVRPPETALFEVLLGTREIKVPNLKTKILILLILEGISTLYFSVDIILRLLSCPSLKSYFLSVINVTDALSLLGGSLYLLLYYMYPLLRYGSWIDVFAYMPMLRPLRLFRIVSNVRAGRVLAYSFRANCKDVFVLVLFLLTGTFTFATLFYLSESESTVKSIPDAWYWALITMTTVGYGDVHPMTTVGRLVACLCAMTGILLFSLTVPVFANHFLILYQHVESENIVRKVHNRRISARHGVKVETGEI